MDTRSGNFTRVDTTSARSDKDLLIIENRSTVVTCLHDRPMCVPGTLYQVSSQISVGLGEGMVVGGLGRGGLVRGGEVVGAGWSGGRRGIEPLLRRLLAFWRCWNVS